MFETLGPKEGGAEAEKNDDWYNKALNKAQSFLSAIDRDLQVALEERTIHPDEGDSHEAVVLHFWRAKKPSIEWTMDIKK